MATDGRVSSVLGSPSFFRRAKFALRYKTKVPILLRIEHRTLQPFRKLYTLPFDLVASTSVLPRMAFQFGRAVKWQAALDTSMSLPGVPSV